MKKKSIRVKKNTRRKRSVPLSGGAMKVMEQQLEKFRQQFGRDPGPDDPVFFDADADMPQLIDHDKAEEALLVAMTAAGIAPELIHAIQRTGRFVTEENSHLLPKEALAEWQAAIEEYRHLQRTGKFN
jgi:site-specific recombinase XerD